MKIALRKAVLFSITLAAAVVVSVSASAQSNGSSCDSAHCKFPATQSYHFVTPSYHGYRYPSYGYGFRPVGYDYRYGAAELTRARAQANLLNSHARTQNAHAAQMEMESSVQFLATRLERKRINNESRFGHLRARGESVRQAKFEQVVAQPPVERPIVDPVSGQVDWPMLLRSTYFAKARKPIDLVFRQRSEHGRINPDYFLPMRDWIELIECELKANVAYYEMEDYLEAKAFLRNLVDEARVDLDAGAMSTQLVSK